MLVSFYYLMVWLSCSIFLIIFYLLHLSILRKGSFKSQTITVHLPIPPFYSSFLFTYSETLRHFNLLCVLENMTTYLIIIQWSCCQFFGKILSQILIVTLTFSFLFLSTVSIYIFDFYFQPACIIWTQLIETAYTWVICFNLLCQSLPLIVSSDHVQLM
jgi:hypothetical protein